MGEIVLPPFEDAGSIQFTLRQIAQMLLEQKITEKKAGLLLYTLQIASSNLKQMNAEKPRPTQVVVDPETVGETPLGQTPWSASGQGHDPEVEAGAGESEAGGTRAESENQAESKVGATARLVSINRWVRENPDSTYEKLRHMLDIQIEAWCMNLDPDSIRWGKCGEEQGLPPGTIQACEEGGPYMV